MTFVAQIPDPMERNPKPCMPRMLKPRNGGLRVQGYTQQFKVHGLGFGFRENRQRLFYRNQGLSLNQGFGVLDPKHWDNE